MRCLESLKAQSLRCVYVDSGSTDASVTEARSRDMEVVELDLSTPFTAARARNAGYRRLVEVGDPIDYVHFVDGDCEICPGWLGTAQDFLEQRHDVGIVFGLQKERHPEASIYSTLLDVEWDTAFGEVATSAGLLMCRTELFDRVGGFREDLIAGEDPEFCLRARLTGARIWHLHDPMAFHDGNMMRFTQWWRRAMRTGYAFAEGFKLHGKRPVSHYRRELGSVYVWAVIIPVLVLIASIVVSRWCLLGLLLYPLQVVRIAMRGRRDARSNWLYALFVVIGKLPEFLGVVRFHRDRIRNRQKLLIEYK